MTFNDTLESAVRMNKSALTLAGRVALVVGGTGSLGVSIARKLALCGMLVAVSGRSEERAVKVASGISAAGGTAAGFGCDLREPDQIDLLVSRVVETFGGLDVLVNNAGMLDQNSIENTTLVAWDEVQRVNSGGVFFATQKALPHLRKSAAPRVVNISSNAGRMGGFENGLAYSASKGAVIALTYGFARRLAPDGITVNCIAPGTIDSEMSRARPADALKSLLTRFPVGRLGTPDEVAAAVCYFASEEAGFTTGAVLDVNGGLFMG
jgi:3-oxoacyl-[acyl-carrier protein] reductase